MTPAELLAELEAQGISLEPKGDRLRVRALQEPDPATLALLRKHKATLLEHLSTQGTLPRLPWQLERLLSAAAGGVLRCDLRGVPDVGRYALAWGCAYLMGDHAEALERLWALYDAWQKEVN